MKKILNFIIIICILLIIGDLIYRCNNITTNDIAINNSDIPTDIKFINFNQRRLDVQFPKLATIENINPVIKPTPDTMVVSIDYQWEIFVNALILVESEGKPQAVGKTNDLGIFQITPIYVKDVNRIIKEDKYTHSDALDSLKSIEMFNIIQGHYNPNKCIKRAIKYHNPKAGKWYSDRILKKMTDISGLRLVDFQWLNQ